jgi:hypothetical protein
MASVKEECYLSLHVPVTMNVATRNVVILNMDSASLLKVGIQALSFCTEVRDWNRDPYLANQIAYYFTYYLWQHQVFKGFTVTSSPKESARTRSKRTRKLLQLD